METANSGVLGFMILMEKLMLFMCRLLYVYIVLIGYDTVVAHFHKPPKRLNFGNEWLHLWKQAILFFKMWCYKYIFLGRGIGQVPRVGSEEVNVSSYRVKVWSTFDFRSFQFLSIGEIKQAHCSLRSLQSKKNLLAYFWWHVLK